MPKCWQVLSQFLLFSVASVYAASFENTAIVRTVELGGSVVLVTTTYAIKSLEDGSKVYTVALGREEHKTTSFLEAKLKGKKEALPLVHRPVDASGDYQLIDVTLPRALSANQSANLVLESLQTHATYPWPKSVGQKDEQSLKYTTDLFVLSPYHTTVQRSKLKALVPRFLSHTKPKNVDQFSSEGSVTVSGATTIYGPYNNIPKSTNGGFIAQHQQPVTVHYYHEQPVLEIFKLKRSAEISHWGANLNTQDDIILHNAGPALKGHFSRLEHQAQSYYKKPSPHVLPAISLPLPAGIRNVYYYDTIGNVSTSKLRAAPSVQKQAFPSQSSVLELRPRYPLLGGWNYSFTIGWDAPLGDSASYDSSTGKYIVGVPTMIPWMGTVIDEVEIQIILPEGATDVEFATPFPPAQDEVSVHKTYLDTKGRPALTLRYKNLTAKHVQNIYVSYKVSASAHLTKPLTVSTAFFGVFLLAIFARRVNLTIHPQK